MPAERRNHAQISLDISCGKEGDWTTWQGTSLGGIEHLNGTSGLNTTFDNLSLTGNFMLNASLYEWTGNLAARRYSEKQYRKPSQGTGGRCPPLEVCYQRSILYRPYRSQPRKKSRQDPEPSNGVGPGGLDPRQQVDIKPK